MHRDYYNREDVKAIFDRKKILLIGENRETLEAVPYEMALDVFGAAAVITASEKKPWGNKVDYFTLEGLERAAAWYNLRQIERW